MSSSFNFLTYTTSFYYFYASRYQSFTIPHSLISSEALQPAKKKKGSTKERQIPILQYIFLVDHDRSLALQPISQTQVMWKET